MKQLQTKQSKGFVYIATKNVKYLYSAIISAQTIRDHFPEASITLFTTPDLVIDEVFDVFDSVITEGVPDDRRAKLWALSRTPYDITAYIDADTYIEDAEITTMFDQLGDNDMLFTKIRKYNSNMKGYLDDPGYIYHGGVCLYRKTDKTIHFMQEWWRRWNETRQSDVFAVEYPQIPNRMTEWDQFYLWYLINRTEHGLKIGFFIDDARWNFVTGYLRDELNGKPVIIKHHTIKL